MYCIRCGIKLENGTEVCPRCGELMDTRNYMVKKEEEEKVKAWPCIFSAIIPIVGLILFIIWQNERPQQAKKCGICALIFYALGLLPTLF